ncbi:MAG: hypothetical protein ACHQ50_10220, partial [Fimbriimonadales bacterium]
ADDTVPYDSSTQGIIQSTPAPESAKWWAQQDGCGAMKEATKDSGNVIVDDYAGGRNGAEVEFISIVKGDHGWPQATNPDSGISATDLIWDFFRSHPKHH